MRTTTSSLLLLLSLLFFFTFRTKFSPVLAADTKPVRDRTGKILQTGVEYYVLASSPSAGGGVTLGRNKNGTEICPYDVFQEPSVQSSGIPVTFTPVDPKKRVIGVSTDLNIEFSVDATICVQSLVWKLGDFDESRRQYFITTNGVKGNPGLETLSNWFKIEKETTELSDYSYKLVFCPSVCDLCKPICKDIGIYYYKDGTRRLALLSDEVQRPFVVVFARADDQQLIKMN
ncbi:Proteinase inhibitor I3 [Macleaya cordata]|uniref:Proteinase inhibitor I3 n=1 Tax=Macleaya cordata TaxID=56857 RepID=A0A200QJX1_MACCD|nr:Proteinase inhibitor I3 [Macleaya cordata]